MVIPFSRCQLDAACRAQGSPSCRTPFDFSQDLIMHGPGPHAAAVPNNILAGKASLHSVPIPPSLAQVTQRLLPCEVRVS